MKVYINIVFFFKYIYLSILHHQNSTPSLTCYSSFVPSSTQPPCADLSTWTSLESSYLYDRMRFQGSSCTRTQPTKDRSMRRCILLNISKRRLGGFAHLFEHVWTHFGEAKLQFFNGEKGRIMEWERGPHRVSRTSSPPQEKRKLCR